METKIQKKCSDNLHIAIFYKNQKVTARIDKCVTKIALTVFINDVIKYQVRYGRRIVVNGFWFL